MIRLKPSVEILEEIPHILLVPTRYTDQFKLSLGDLKAFLHQQFKLSNLGSQSPEAFEIEECDYIVAMKKSQKDNYFCALKILFKSFHDGDTQLKISVLYSLKERYMLEMYDGNNYQHLDCSSEMMSSHIAKVQHTKRRFFHENLSAFYIHN